MFRSSGQSRDEHGRVDARELDRMTHCRIPISAVGVVGAVDIGEEQCVEASPFEQLCQSNPPLQIPVAARGFIERMFPHALDLMIRGALDEPVQNQVVGHTRNLAQARQGPQLPRRARPRAADLRFAIFWLRKDRVREKGGHDPVRRIDDFTDA